MKLFKRIEINVLATAMLYIVLGLLFVLLPGVTERVICYLIAAALALMGIVYIVEFFRGGEASIQKNSLAVGMLLALAALFMLLKTNVVVAAIPILLGMAVVVSGVLKLQNTIILYRMRNRLWIAALVLSLLCVAFGVVLIEDPFLEARVLITVIGTALLFSGITDIVMLFIMSRKIKEIKKASKEAAHERVAPKPLESAEIPTKDTPAQ